MWRHWTISGPEAAASFPRGSASGKATDLTPVDHDVPTIATGGDGDVTVSPDGKTSSLRCTSTRRAPDNTNVDIYAVDAVPPDRSPRSRCDNTAAGITR